METKVCSKCKKDKPVEEFYKIKSGCGPRPECKKCSYAMQKRYKVKNPEKVLAIKRKFNDRHRSAINEKNLQWTRAIPERRMLIAARARAKRKNLPFDLEISDICIPDFCPVLGIKLVVNKKRQNDYSPSLDRIVPEKGYVKGNIAVISHRANAIKNCGTIEEHEKVISYIKSYS